MPTLECLDERTQQIQKSITMMDEKLTRRFDSFDEGVNERLAKLEKDVAEIKINSAREDGQKSVTLWVGGAVLALLGAIGNMTMLWLLGPNGILSKPPIGH